MGVLVIEIAACNDASCTETSALLPPLILSVRVSVLYPALLMTIVCVPGASVARL